MKEKPPFIFYVLFVLAIGFYILMLPMSDWIDSQKYSSGVITELISTEGDTTFVYFVEEGGETEILVIREPIKSIIVNNGIPGRYVLQLRYPFSYQEYSQYRYARSIMETE